MKKSRFFCLLYVATIAAVLLTAHLGSHVVTTLAENTPIPRAHTILIDPGHGGVDGGATSCSNQLESQYNLEISLRLRDLFQFLGADIAMTRDTDISIHKNSAVTIAQKKASDLKERTRIANELDNGLLLSIHQNHYSDERSQGPQVFYGKTPGSDRLAKELQTALSKLPGVTGSRRSSQSKGIYLMEHIQCPGVLIECGFISNREEDARLRTPEYQKQLCTVIAATVSQFLSNT